MGKEIERKFLVNNNAYRKNAVRKLIHQGFLNTEKERVVRVRTEGDKAIITIKGISIGPERAEFEYEIPRKDAAYLLQKICIQPIIKKYRFKTEHNGFIWEVDEFLEENRGLVVAEIELPEIDTVFELPEWIGDEVTADPKYFNANLIKNPFTKWNNNA
jgi:CYTH domain-containing protein